MEQISEEMRRRRVPRFADGSEVSVPRESLVGRMYTEVERFQREIIGFPVPSEPTALDDERVKFSAGAMREEVDEFEASAWKRDLDGMADALIDLTYFALGRLVEMGIAPLPVFEEVHAANMRKRRGGLSKRPNSKGYDAVKPEGWTPPDLRPMLSVTRDDIEEIVKRKASVEGLYEMVRNEFKLSFPDRPLIPAKPAVFDALPARPMPKLLVIGHARHGKDTVCEMLRDLYGFRFTSSSMFCAERIVFPALMGVYRYKTPAECFADRGRHRREWYELIKAYNREDPSRLGREIFEQHDVYAGLRSSTEFHALRNSGAFDMCVWVDASDRLPPEPSSSMTLEPWMADFVLDNNGDLKALQRGLGALMSRQILPPLEAEC